MYLEQFSNNDGFEYDDIYLANSKETLFNDCI